MKPIDMILYCPNCGMQHIDAPDNLQDVVHAGSGTVVDQLWTNPPHKSHLCHGCRCVWRPADVATNGVAELKTSGKGDTWPAVHNEEVTAMPARGMAAPLAGKFMPGAIFAWNCLESTAVRIENIEARNTVREFLMRAWHHEVQPAVSAADGVKGPDHG